MTTKKHLIDLIYNYLEKDELEQLGEIGKSQTNFTQFLINEIPLSVLQDLDFSNFTLENLLNKEVEGQVVEEKQKPWTYNKTMFSKDYDFDVAISQIRKNKIRSIIKN
jgi:hypothetical protein